MFPGFEKIVEERIRKAQKEGAFDGLPGAGQPLPIDDMDIPEDLRLAYKVLKNADFIPRSLSCAKKFAVCRSCCPVCRKPVRNIRPSRK
jgi:hypothetical protein